MSERVIEEFRLDEAVVVCPNCQAGFVTSILVHTPDLSGQDTVEADLHRVFPDAEIRGALLSVCADCKYCAWTSQFKPANVKPELVKREPQIDATKKFALAVKWAREKKYHHLDIGFIALNGLWCSREAGEDDSLWLELTAIEHEKGLKQSPSRPEEEGYLHLALGEVYRQMRQFEKALKEYEIALADTSINREILQHQIGLAQRSISGVTPLPHRIVKELFPELPPLPEASAIKSESNETNETFEPSVVSAEESATIDSSTMLSAISSLISASPKESEIQPAPAANVHLLKAPNSLPAHLIMADGPKHYLARSGGILTETTEDGWLNDYASYANSLTLTKEKKGDLPALTIDNPDEEYFGTPEIISDHTDAISRVENFLSFSRQGYYNRNWNKSLNI